jgi:hypothetical protein
MLPALTIAGVLLGELLAGAVVTETVFGRNGIGQPDQQEVSNQDGRAAGRRLISAAASCWSTWPSTCCTPCWTRDSSERQERSHEQQVNLTAAPERATEAPETAASPRGAIPWPQPDSCWPGWSWGSWRCGRSPRDSSPATARWSGTAGDKLLPPGADTARHRRAGPRPLLAHRARLHHSLTGALVAVSVGLVVGTLLGLIAGSVGGVTDTVVMRIVDVLLSIPGLLLSLSIIIILGFGTVNAAIAVGVGSIASFARLSRSEVLRVRRSDYVEAAFGSGGTLRAVLWRHVLPNSLGSVLGAGRPAVRRRHPGDLHARVPRLRRAAAHARMGAADRRGRNYISPPGG